ncbi:MAG: hypothetical protein ACI4VN_05210 [Clostridia bacterium]
MKTAEIIYKGKRVKAQIDDKGRVLIKLPDRDLKNNHSMTEIMARSDNAWCFTSQSNQYADDYCMVWLYDDGNIEWCNDMTKRRMSAGKFKPGTHNREFPENVAQEMYDVSQQLREYEELGMSEFEITDLAAKMLEVNLNLLGYNKYESIFEDIPDLAGYGVLGKIGDILQNYRNFREELNQRRRKQADKYPEILPPTAEDKKLSDTLEQAGQTVIPAVNFMRNQDTYLSRGRSIDPTFYKDMPKKVTPDDWETYSSVVRKTATLLLELNYDLLGYSIRKKLTDCSSLTGDELETRISKLIDSYEFDRACNIEDRFIIAECERMASKPETIEEDFELEALKREAMATREEKTRYARRYDSIQAYCYDSRRIKKEREGASLDD